MSARKHRLPVPFWGLAIAAVAILVGTAEATAPVATVAETKPIPVVADCNSVGHTGPTKIVFACADLALRVHNIVWKSWESDSARGSGIEVRNLCQPTCAKGEISQTQIRITLTGASGTDRHFTRAIFAYPDGRTEVVAIPGRRK